jgi:hypothetical protein
MQQTAAYPGSRVLKELPYPLFDTTMICKVSHCWHQKSIEKVVSAKVNQVKIAYLSVNYTI